eukprot:30479-Pelagococcus_subviridis.AAC.2
MSDRAGGLPSPRPPPPPPPPPPRGAPESSLPSPSTPPIPTPLPFTLRPNQSRCDNVGARLTSLPAAIAFAFAFALSSAFLFVASVNIVGVIAIHPSARPSPGGGSGGVNRLGGFRRASALRAIPYKYSSPVS